MPDFILTFFLSRPRRFVILGRFLLQIGGFLVIAGLAGRIATVSIQTVRGLSGHAPSSISLGELYPGLPTWWVPEDEFGYAFTFFIFIVGVVLTRIGKECSRLVGH